MECPFCKFQHLQEKIVARSTHCYAIFDEFAVSKGHILIISNQHADDWFTVKTEIQRDIMKLLNRMKIKLDKEFSPDGYNIGMNCRKAAGQTVMHLHVHLIPRYIDDVENPQGGVRGVIPEKQQY